MERCFERVDVPPSAGLPPIPATPLLSRHRTSWQDGYYDTLVKTARQFEYVAYYIEQNPVAKGLVERAEQWNESSAHRTDLITEPWPYVYDEE